MSKQVDLDQLFNRDFDSYQIDTSPAFDLAMEKKIKRMKWLYYMKWTLGIAIIGGLLIASIVFINKDRKADQTHQNPNKLVELNKTVEPSEIGIINKEEFEESIPISNNQSGAIEESFINEPPQETFDESRIPIAEISTFEFEETHTDDISIEISRKVEFEEITINNKTVSIDYQVEREVLVEKINFTLPSIPIKAEKAKKQKKQKDKVKKQKDYAKAAVTTEAETKKPKKKQNEKVKQEDIAIIPTIKSRESYQKSKPSKQKVSNEKTQNEASTALVIKPKKVKRVHKPSDFSGSIELGFSPIFFKNMAAPYEPNEDTVTFFITNKKAIRYQADSNL